MTIEQLLTHTSGIPNLTTNDEYLATLMKKEMPLAEIIKKYCSDALEFRSGEGFRYSNSGYIILASIIERASGRSFAAQLQEKIFTPLHMTHSGTGNQRINSTGYWMDQPEPVFPRSNLTGAGSIWSTAADLMKYDEAMYTDRLLPQSGLQESFKPRSGYADWDADYGYGWMLDRRLFKQSKEHVIQYHPGTDMGYYSMFLRQPDEQILIVLLSNNGDFPRFDITDLILNTLN